MKDLAGCDVESDLTGRTPSPAQEQDALEISIGCRTRVDKCRINKTKIRGSCQRFRIDFTLDRLIDATAVDNRRSFSLLILSTPFS